MLGCGTGCLIILALAGAVTAGIMPYPWHASCKIEWTMMSESCTDVKQKLLDQIEQWKGDANCGTPDDCPKMPCGQKCLYEVSSVEDNKIEATHKTPVKRYIDNLSFEFIEEAGSNCKVAAFSTSSIWYAVLDFGTNYCNLRNLLDGEDGPRFKEGTDFTENTEDSVCTQYTSRDCNRF